jgi:uncharacterized OB-fold protein
MSEPSPDPVSQRYWDRVRPLGFALPHCESCGRFHFYPKPACPYCAGDRIAPACASGLGSVYSYSVVYRAPSPAFADAVPYAVAIIATDEGPHLMTRIVGVDAGDVRIGMRMRVRLDGPEPTFEPADAPEAL